ncbi:conserved Plasmodium protein, unknown function [Plasmodium knowlesi strain H]|uniref:Uncharacterized protein n=3 Tax=Plasmodium knowlesi TaxID=5850 RepID=A0A1A7VCG9_PLAKH|nr:conserved Plasmodium protein, unknown function [Plasmodium knowlesi strain H]OTN67744.1 Uncharacterized protein PKNOH_S05375300 [Plasmodium knowlesi]CAA9990343.1 conserved Plasmodium protein, unknown function [Plasmodium knowlesi strain H]SBO19549.1 conserved Plasmodium protein, unknown function [Plasmodium knowlesi strain H]SBO22735.1 conserved Plasmodium protein, unknown function [Plasmodium knowlesi strain H]VVS79817.1 conserved Plasmodium protein, unknown function [Plasmodium knowlesi s
MESFNIGKNVNIDFLEPAITISVLFICLYMIISTDNPAHLLIRSIFFKSKIFLWELKDIFTNINFFALIFCSFFFLSHYILHVLKYEKVWSLFCVNYDYYDKILSYKFKDISIKSLFQNSISEKNYLVNLLYSFKFFFNIFFLNDASLIQIVFTSFIVFVLLSLYAKQVSRVVFIISILASTVLSGFIPVFFLKKVLNVEYDHSGEEIFSFLFLIFLYKTNPYLSVFQYNDRSLHPYHGTELRLYIHLLFFVKYLTYEGKFYEVKALVAVIISAIVFLPQAIESFQVHTFVKIIWLAAYYFVNNYVPFAFSGNFTFTKLFHYDVVDLLRNEFKNNISLHNFNVLSRIPFNYLVTKICFFWIPYILLTRTNKNLKYLIMLLMSINLIATSTYLAKNIFPGIPLNMLLLFFLNKIGI